MTARVAALIAALVLIAEYLLLSFAFDVQPIRAREDVAGWIGWLGAVAPLFVVALAVTLAVAQGAGGSTWRPSPVFVPLLAVHIAAYGALWGLTPRLASSSSLDFAWLAAAGAAFLAGAGAALPRLPTAPELRAALPRAALIAGVSLMAYLSSYAGEFLWRGLEHGTLLGAAVLLVLWGERPLLNTDAQLLGIDDFVVEVSYVCSGMEGLTLIVVFVSAYLVLDRRRLRMPAAWLALPVAAAMVLAANVLRIAALVWIGHHASEEIALGGFHSKAGWILFSAIALLATALTRRAFGLKEGRAHDTVSAPAADASPYLIPLLALIGAHMVAGLFVVDAPRAYPFGIGAAVVALTIVRGGWPRDTWTAPNVPTAVAVGMVTYGLWYMTVSPTAAEAAERLAAGLRHDYAWIGIRVLGSVAVVPLVEELAFRSFLLRRLTRRGFSSVDPRDAGWIALVGSSLVFGFLHQDMLAGTIAGLAYGALYMRTGRLSDSTLAHAITNAAIAVHVLVGDAWWLWV